MDNASRRNIELIATLALWIGDHKTVRNILTLTDELKQRARAIAKPEEAKSEIAPRESGKKNGPSTPEGRRVLVPGYVNSG
jgi:hypothetical protein